MISPALTLAHSIKAMVEVMRDMPQVETQVNHHFSPGIYARESIIPADTIAVGKVHLTRHLNIISKGKCLVITPVRRMLVEAPLTFESLAGEQKVVHILEDTVWTTIHATEETDIAKIEADCVSDEYDDKTIQTLIESLGDNLCLS